MTAYGETMSAQQIEIAGSTLLTPLATLQAEVNALDHVQPDSTDGAAVSSDRPTEITNS